jgi:hypothetical protein
MPISLTLPYTAETLRAFLAGYHADIWPAQAVAVVLTLGMLVPMARPVPHAGRLVCLGLAVFWAWTGAVFFLRGFSALSFLAPAYGVAFLVQAALLLGVAAVRPPSGFVLSRTSGVLLVLALVVYPLALVALEGEWRGWRLLGVTPVATTLFTLGVVMAATAGRWTKAMLSAIPTVHLVAAGATAWVLAAPRP